MAATLALQTVLDGPRNCVIKITGSTVSADQSYTIIAAPGNFQGIDFSGTLKAADWWVKRINYNVQDGLSVQLLWDATTPLLLQSLEGRGKMEAEHYGGLPNNAGAGKTGSIGIQTTGGAASATQLNYTIEIELVKTQNL
jgi:hypothetical protein